MSSFLRRGCDPSRIEKKMNQIIKKNTDTSQGSGEPGKFILASASPRREELLKELLKEFDICPSNINEKQIPGEAPEPYVIRISREKAEMTVPSHGGETLDVWVLAADTIVVLGQDILGKPRNNDDARRMLGRLQDRDHEVITGVCLLNRKRGVFEQNAVRSRVWMRRLEQEEIDTYIATGEPFDKAGGYAIQGLAGRFIQGVDGSFSNVVGLPMEYVKETFKRLGVP